MGERPFPFPPFPYNGTNELCRFLLCYLSEAVANILDLHVFPHEITQHLVRLVFQAACQGVPSLPSQLELLKIEEKLPEGIIYLIREITTKNVCHMWKFKAKSPSQLPPSPTSMWSLLCASSPFLYPKQMTHG